MTTQAEFYQANAVDGVLTDAQMAQLIELPEGDTVLVADSGEPNAASDDTTAPKAEQAQEAPTEADPEKSVVLAKDGVHTIPYSKLVEARTGEQTWKSQAEAAQLELEALKAEAQARADAGQAPTQTDANAATAAAAIDLGVDPEIFGDYSEAALAKGIKTLVAMGMAQATEQIRGELSNVVAPFKQNAEQAALQEHYKTIYDKHADADSLAESKELADWIATKPSFVRNGYQAVLSQGTAADVVELFDAFKAENGKAQSPGASKVDVSAAAKAAIANAKSPVPASLSDFPGGTAAPSDEMEAMRQMTGVDLMGKFEGKSPDQIAALMARLL